jgi:uncharacterized protein (TIGR02145 family)
VKIGEQVWMAENLNFAKFKNGNIKPQAKSKETWEIARKNKQPAWCYYDNNAENQIGYGKLYNLYAVNEKRGLAPIGNHIPSLSEWG